MNSELMQVVGRIDEPSLDGASWHDLRVSARGSDPRAAVLFVVDHEATRRGLRSDAQQTCSGPSTTISTSPTWTGRTLRQRSTTTAYTEASTEWIWTSRAGSTPRKLLPELQATPSQPSAPSSSLSRSLQFASPRPAPTRASRQSALTSWSCRWNVAQSPPLPSTRAARMRSGFWPALTASGRPRSSSNTRFEVPAEKVLLIQQTSRVLISIGVILAVSLGDVGAMGPRFRPPAALTRRGRDR